MYGKIKEYENVEHFKCIPISDNLYERINIVDEYILEKEKLGKTVYILDAMAAVFNVPINRYHKNYDMFNLGNFGTKGETGIIEDLENEENTLVFIKKEIYPKNWQAPINVIEYVKKNFKRIDEVDIFDVYEI